MRTPLAVAALFSAATAAAAQAPAAPPPADTGIVRGPVAARVDAYLRGLVPYGYTGSVALVIDGRSVLERGYGLADRGKRVAFDAATGIPTGSIAKPFTHVAVLQLAAEGKLRLGDSLSRFFPDVPANKAAITVRQLLEHRAGLPLYHADDDVRLTKAEFLKRAFGAPLRFAPGSGEAYSNTGYGVLAAIIEAVTGRDHESAIRERVFVPAGMTRTGWRSMWSPARVARAYGPAGGDVGTMLDLPAADDGGLSWSIRGAGGLLSTAGDLTRFQAALPRLLPAAVAGEWPGAAAPMLMAGGDGRSETVVGRLRDAPVLVAVNSMSAGEGVAGSIVQVIGRLVAGTAVEIPPAVVAADDAALRAAAESWPLPTGGRITLRPGEGALVATAEGQNAFDLLSGADPATRARREALSARTDSIVRAWRAGDWAPLHRALAPERPFDDFARDQAARLASQVQRLGPLVSHAVLGTRPMRQDGMTTVRLQFERGAIYQRLGWEGPTIALFTLGPEEPGDRFFPIAGGAFARADLRSGRTIVLRPGGERLVVEGAGARTELGPASGRSGDRANSVPALSPPRPQTRVLEGPPEDLSASDPRASRAVAVALAVLGGDREAAERAIAEHGAPGVAGSEAMRAELARVIPATRARSVRLLRTLQGFEADVIVQALVDDVERSLVVRLERAAPHRVIGFARVDLRVDG